MAEDSKNADGSGSEPVNINIVKKDYNKENLLTGASRIQQKPRPPPAVGGNDHIQSSGTDIYENIDVQDINSKLSRLQDLLKKAKNN